MKLLLTALMMISMGSESEAAGISTTQYPAVTNSQKSGQLGIGLAVGSITGLSTQFWLENERALNAAFGVERGNAAISAAHLWLFRNALENEGPSASYFVPYIGIGAIAASGSQPGIFSRNTESFAVAAQMPLGFEFLPQQERFDIYAQIVPSLEVTPLAVGFLTGDIGARFYF